MRVKLRPALRNFRSYLTAPQHRRGLACVLLVLLIAALQCLQLDHSIATLKNILLRKPVYIFLNGGLVLIVDLLLVMLTMRWHVAMHLGNIFFTFWGIANRFTLLFHGEPITLVTLASTGTALNVIRDYTFTPDDRIWFSLAILAVNTVLTIVLQFLYPGKQRFSWRRLRDLALTFAVLTACAAFSFAALEVFDPGRGFGWLLSYRPYTREQGYPVYFVRQAYRSVNPIQKPDGYSDKKVRALAEELSGQAGQSEGYPDIIFILNETFYDLDLYMDTDTDVPFLANWYAADNAIRGSAMVPEIGGGTNNSEFELLTSNSMSLLTCKAPFLTMSLRDSNSIASYLKTLGYSTMALHAQDPANYNRSSIYPQLGFDTMHFDYDFPHHELYGNRKETDAANYQDMITWYEQSGDGPRFLYMLTYQNHGGHRQNDESYDLVHTRRDLGKETDRVDEYLTCIYMSDEALADLMNYFDQVDRPVLLCMVGDHSPAFLEKLPAREGLTEDDIEIIGRSSPFIIWGNKAFGPIETEDSVTLNMTDLAPTVLELAGMPLSPYYRYILDFSEEVPLRLSTGFYRTAEGDTGYSDRKNPREEQFSAYYYMEYNNLQKKDERYQVLFDPPGPEVYLPAVLAADPASD